MHRTRAFLILFALGALLFGGCDSNSAMEDPPDLPPEPPAPSISISSLEVALAGGGTGLQFFAQADQDIFCKKVTVAPPAPFEPTTYNVGNAFFIKEQAIGLQSSNAAYRKVGGSWTFTFEVTVGSGASARDHTVRVNYGVSGKRTPAGPSLPITVDRERR